MTELIYGAGGMGEISEGMEPPADAGEKPMGNNNPSAKEEPKV